MLWIQAYYNYDKIAESLEVFETETDKYTYGGFTLTVPANDYPDIRGLTFSIAFRLSGSATYTLYGNAYILQDKK